MTDITDLLNKTSEEKTKIALEQAGEKLKTIVYVGIASRNYGVWPCFSSLMHNIFHCANNGIMMLVDPCVGDSLIERARQEMQHRFYHDYPQSTHFFQLDDDIELPIDAVYKLVKADKDIIGGAYRLKTEKRRTAALRAFKTFNISEVPEDHVMKIKYLSTGCFLQKRHVVEGMQDMYPELKYMANEIITGKEDAQRWGVYLPFIHENELLSEDWAYCQRALDAGYDIHLHTGVLCGHWGLKKYSLFKHEQTQGEEK